MESDVIAINKNTFCTKNVIGVICRIQESVMQQFNVQLSNSIDQIPTQNKMVSLMGDYVIDLLNSSNHEYTSEFVDILHSDEFLPLTSSSTNTTSNSATLISFWPSLYITWIATTL